MKDSHTGKKYYIGPTGEALLKISIPISYLLYGLFVAMFFDKFGFQSDTVILVLVVAYAIELLLDILDMFSPTKVIFGVFLAIVILPILIDLSRAGIVNLFKINPNRMKRIMDVYNGVESCVWNNDSKVHS